jgi:hypothetical protein
MWQSGDPDPSSDCLQCELKMITGALIRHTKALQQRFKSQLNGDDHELICGGICGTMHGETRSEQQRRLSCDESAWQC